jgi:hypothetical protein
MRHQILGTSLALILGLGAAHAGAATVELPLTNLRGGAAIQNYFIGGSDSVPTDGTGPNLGFTFSANATAQTAGGTNTGKVENNPVPSLNDVLFFSSSGSTPAYMNYAAGFNSLTFDYSYSNNTGATGFAYLYSGLNGTGTLLDTVALGPATSGITACASRLNAYCTWQAVSTGTFNGVAESVVFSGAVGGAGSTTASPTTITEFTGLTVAPVPLPAALWLMLSGVSGLAAFRRRRTAAA